MEFKLGSGSLSLAPGNFWWETSILETTRLVSPELDMLNLVGQNQTPRPYDSLGN